MGDTDNTTVHRGTKFSRYWYRRGHDTTRYIALPRYLKYSGIFTNFHELVLFFVLFLIAKNFQCRLERNRVK